ncbi:hypothetical protein ACLOJK_000988 [Asimina triloba]
MSSTSSTTGGRSRTFAEAVAAIMALAAVIRSSEATTMMELEIELKKTSDTPEFSAIEITEPPRTSAAEYEDFNAAKSCLIERGEKFGEISLKLFGVSRKRKEETLDDSRHEVIFILQVACSAHVNMIWYAEGRPDRTGFWLSKKLVALGICVKLLIDSAVAYTMDEVDMVLVGADGVVESGGIINMMGTYQISLVAHSTNKPVYVAAESYKLVRLYPLDQKDLAPAICPIDFGILIPAGMEVEKSARDYTPPRYLTHLFTDLGVLTPSVVSDELIQLYL